MDFSVEIPDEINIVENKTQPTKSVLVQPADRFRDPGLIVEVHPPLLLRVAGHIRHGLEVPRLGLKPLVDEQLWVLGEAEEELAAGFKTVDGLHRLVDLVVQGLDFLLRRGRQQEIVHLSLQSVVNLKSCDYYW